MAVPAPAVEAAAPAAVPVPAHNWALVDHQVTDVLSEARTRQAAAWRSEILSVSRTMTYRVEREFIPWYLSFGRRKLEELKAYNIHAKDVLVEWITGQYEPSARSALVETFETEFTDRVVRPDDLARDIRRIGREVAESYAADVARGLRGVQDESGLSFVELREYLDRRPPLTYVSADGRVRTIPALALITPHPAWLDLGDEIAAAATTRLDHLPRVVDLATMVDAQGRSIFAVGENAALYFTSYLVYWAGLIILIRTGVIPFSLFSFLLGWVLWETFAWGSWIGLEYLDFEQTRAILSPIIEERAVQWLAQVRSLLADTGPDGPLRALHLLEQPGRP
jgi:hypothetical protein